MSRFYNTETPIGIYNWSKDTFGPRTPLMVAGRTSCEVSELVVALVNGHSNAKLGGEIADVAIMLWQLAAAHSCDARPAVDERLVAVEEPEARPEIDEKMVGALKPGIVSIGLALNRHFSLYIERVALKPKEPRNYLVKALMALEWLARDLELSLPELVDAKMKINRARTWEEVGAGHFQHSEVAA